MTAQLVPTPSGATPFLTQTTTLDGVPYILAYRYSQREDRWYLQLQTIDGAPIYGSVKLVPNWPLFAQCVDARRPPGQFLVISNTKSDLSPPGLNELAPGARCQLCYVPIADIQALVAGASA
jgi:hypothetical protein